MLSNLFLVFFFFMAGLLVGLSIYEMCSKRQFDDTLDNQVSYDDQGKSNMRQLVLCLALSVPLLIVLLLLL